MSMSGDRSTRSFIASCSVYRLTGLCCSALAPPRRVGPLRARFPFDPLLHVHDDLFFPSVTSCPPATPAATDLSRRSFGTLVFCAPRFRCLLRLLQRPCARSRCDLGSGRRVVAVHLSPRSRPSDTSVIIFAGTATTSITSALTLSPSTLHHGFHPIR